MAGSWNCGVSCPRDWVPLPLAEDVDPWVWARHEAPAVAALAGHAAPEPEFLRALENDLASRAEDSRSRAPIHAFALYRDALPDALAVLEVTSVEPDDTVPEITLRWLEEAFTAPEFGTAQSLSARLPAGPAVRLRQRVAGAEAYPGGGRPVVETLTYGVLPRGFDLAVLVLVSWTALAAGDALVETADRIAETLRVTPAG